MVCFLEVVEHFKTVGKKDCNNDSRPEATRESASHRTILWQPHSQVGLVRTL